MRRRVNHGPTGPRFAIVDEVDSILIDEARTPLIISGPSDESTKLYYQFACRPDTPPRRGLRGRRGKADGRPTEAGIAKVERQLGVENLYDAVSVNYVHQLTKALDAKELYHRDKDYIVADGEVKIVDEFTGRVLEGRRWSDGLHQAVEAKERVSIQEENHTWATVTLQNYFRMYDKLAGMTGTAETEAGEFASTYALPGRPDPHQRGRWSAPTRADLVFKTEDAKFNAVVEDIVERNELGQPVLVGTASVAKSELLFAPARQARRAPQRPQREAALPRGRGRRAGGPPGLRDGRHQHGRSGSRHHLGRQRRAAGPARVGCRGRRRGRRGGGGRARTAPSGGRGALPGRGRGSAQAGWPLRPGQRAAREPAHRQPAPRPFRPPGRPGREPLLPEPRRRAAPAVRHRGDELGDGPNPARGRADRVEDGGQGDRARAEHGGGPQRRDPQGRPQVRRGDGPAAQGDLREASGHHRRRRPRGAHRGSSGRGGREAGGRVLPERVRGGLGHQGVGRRPDPVLPDQVHRRRPRAGRDDR